MALSQIKNLLTFASFRPEPADSHATWSVRFPNKRSLLLNINRNNVSWKVVLKGGKLGDTGVEQGSLTDVLHVMSEDWLSMIDDGWCSVSLNNRFILSLESNLSRKKGYQELLRTNPKAVLGSKYERGKNYAVKHHPETNSSLLLACEEGLIKETQETLKNAGFKTGRLCCGLFAQLCDVLHRLHNAQSSAESKDEGSQVPPNYLVIACCQGSVCILKQKDERWTELRSRSAFYEQGDFSALGQILPPLLLDWNPTFPIIFINDNNDPEAMKQLRQMLPNYSINDVSLEDQLWSIIGKS
jgi:hypothetical protein